MENKYFNCYKCHLYNKFYISKGIKGKNCKRCHCFNYFKKKKKYHRNNFNNHRGNQFPRINNESSINNYHNEPNISYLPQIPLSTYNNFSNINSIHNNYYDSDYNSDSDSDSDISDFGFHYNNFVGYSNNNNNINNIDNNQNNNNIKNNIDNNNIDISWITKVKMNQSIIDKFGKEYECPICLLELNDEIHLTKCEHAFHYKCIVDAIKKNIKDCPICRCNLKTGEKKQSDSIQNVNINIINNNINNNLNNFGNNRNNVDENNRIEINRNNNENNEESNSIRNNKNQNENFMIFFIIFMILISLLNKIFGPFDFSKPAEYLIFR